MKLTRHAFSILGMAVALLLFTADARAQTVQGPDKGGELLRAGEAALEKGEFQSAAAYFARALRASDLGDDQVAIALYKRGVAQEGAGKPAQAIADITSALYLTGLSEKDRAQAYMSRGRAYEAVGMNDLASADKERARSGGAREERIAAAPREGSAGASRGNVPSFETSSQRAAPSFATSVEPSGRASSALSFSTRAEPSGTTSRQRVASFETRASAPSQEEQIPRFRTTILPGEQEKPATRTQGAPAPTASSAPSNWSTSASSQDTNAPPNQPEEARDESGGTVSRFFGNVWSKATGSGERKETNSTTAPLPPSPNWNQSTTEAHAPATNWSPQVATTAQASSPPRASPSPTAAAGAPGGSGYRIQLAALRSDEEAQATWKRLRKKHGALLDSHQPDIVRTELGGLGTFYRVQLGPFPDKAASQQLCETFKRGGLDCFLLAP